MIVDVDVDRLGAVGDGSQAVGPGGILLGAVDVDPVESHVAEPAAVTEEADIAEGGGDDHFARQPDAIGNAQSHAVIAQHVEEGGLHQRGGADLDRPSQVRGQAGQELLERLARGVAAEGGGKLEQRGAEPVAEPCSACVTVWGILSANSKPGGATSRQRWTIRSVGTRWKVLSISTVQNCRVR